MTIVTDDMVQAAFDFLKDHAAIAGAAAAEKTRSEGNVKATRSRLFLTFSGTVAERQARSECHASFLSAVDREANAVEQVVCNDRNMKRAMAIIDAWRTESANERGMGRVG